MGDPRLVPLQDSRPVGCLSKPVCSPEMEWCGHVCSAFMLMWRTWHGTPRAVGSQGSIQAGEGLAEVRLEPGRGEEEAGMEVWAAQMGPTWLP